ncbi:hypothetical protein [Flavobacterium pedocola]
MKKKKKIIPYILKHISIFNCIAAGIFAFSLFEVITFEPKDSNHGMFGALLIVFLLCAIPFLLFDLIMKKIIKNRLLLNFMQFLIVVALCIIFYFKYSDSLF